MAVSLFAAAWDNENAQPGKDPRPAILLVAGLKSTVNESRILTILLQYFLQGMWYILGAPFL